LKTKSEFEIKYFIGFLQPQRGISNGTTLATEEDDDMIAEKKR
jgi:hypothetical protein